MMEQIPLLITVTSALIVVTQVSISALITAMFLHNGLRRGEAFTIGALAAATMLGVTFTPYLTGGPL